MRIVVALSCLMFAHSQASEEPRFFPAGSFSTNPRWEATMQYWYAMHLTGLKESPLCCGAIGRPTTVRFTWLRAFDHPVSIRLNRSAEGKWLVRTKITNGAGGGESGHLITDVTRELSEADAAKILSKVGRDSEYWTMPWVADYSGGKDGAHWVIEVLDGKNYHFVDRWSADGLIRDLGMTFMALSGQQFDPIY